MKDISKFKMFVFIGIITLVGYFAIINQQVSNNLSEFPTIERVVNADAVKTPIPVSIEVKDFRPDGGYELNRKQTKEFDEIVWLSLITGSEVGHGSACAAEPCDLPKIEKKSEWIQQTPRGVLVTKNKYYEWQDENLSKDNISFSTKTHDGINYQFNGHFLSDGNFEESKPKGAMITGQLIKFLNGQKIAEKEVGFNWFSWDEVDQQRFVRIKPSRRKK